VTDERRNAGKRIYVLDTNVLMHDPTAMFRFEEHDVYLPMIVLEELDAGKKGVSEAARNVRQVSRFLDELTSGMSQSDIGEGVPLPTGHSSVGAAAAPTPGRLYFETAPLPSKLPVSLPGTKADNSILGITLALQELHPDARVSLVTKDINLRIKATVLGVTAEDYYNDRALEDLDLLYTGLDRLPDNFWDEHSKDMESGQKDGHTFYKLTGPRISTWYVNQFLIGTDENQLRAMVREIDEKQATIEVIHDYSGSRGGVWGISARNEEQNCALNLLLDPDVDFVTLLGAAGTGKTLLALAAGLTQTLDQNRYREIIMTRVTVPLAEDIGFLPGTEEEKMTPWMGALMDNLEVLTKSEEGGDWGRAATNDILSSRIKIRSLNFMRGRTFLNRYIIIDEAQNLTPKQMRAMITRAGPGTKIICMGNIAQIDTPYLTETTSGLTYVVDRFKRWEHSGHVTLVRGERSRLADYATEVL
jgi:PhoH-like ATPase